LSSTRRIRVGVSLIYSRTYNAVVVVFLIRANDSHVGEAMLPITAYPSAQLTLRLNACCPQEDKVEMRLAPRHGEFLLNFSA
jgi:hypothetical protein